MKIHELKSVPKYFQQIKLGAKTFEIRKNDREFEEGDYLILKEFDGGYTRDGLLCKVVNILMDYEFSGVGKGYCIMSIELITKIK